MARTSREKTYRLIITVEEYDCNGMAMVSLVADTRTNESPKFQYCNLHQPLPTPHPPNTTTAPPHLSCSWPRLVVSPVADSHTPGLSSTLWKLAPRPLILLANLLSNCSDLKFASELLIRTCIHLGLTFPRETYTQSGLCSCWQPDLRALVTHSLSSSYWH